MDAFVGCRNPLLGEKVEVFLFLWTSCMPTVRIPTDTLLTDYFYLYRHSFHLLLLLTQCLLFIVYLRFVATDDGLSPLPQWLSAAFRLADDIAAHWHTRDQRSGGTYNNFHTRLNLKCVHDGFPMCLSGVRWWRCCWWCRRLTFQADGGVLEDFAMFVGSEDLAEIVECHGGLVADARLLKHGLNQLIHSLLVVNGSLGQVQHGSVSWR